MKTATATAAALKLAALGMVLCVALAAGARRNCQTTGDGLGCVKVMGASGWVEFCPAPSVDDTERPSATEDGADDGCVSFRPFGFQELNAEGSFVRQVNNLQPSVGAAVGGEFPQDCTGSVYACANTTNGTALRFTRIPLTASLHGSGGGPSGGGSAGTMQLDIYIIQDDGVITFGEETRSVSKGAYKFDIRFQDYAFASNGVRVQFDIVVKNKNRPTNDVEVRGNEIDGVFWNFAKFVRRASAGASVSWEDIELSTNMRGNQRVVTFGFPGPFVEAFYDPVVPGVSAASLVGALAAVAVSVVAALLL